MAFKIFLHHLLVSLTTSAPQLLQTNVEPYDPPAYTFHYSVSDPSESGTVLSAQESRENEVTGGDYRVSLPDGRIQIVTYSVNGPQGYVADVKYEGEAVHPEAVIKAA